MNQSVSFYPKGLALAMILITLSLATTGCGKFGGKWWIGHWTIDLAYSRDQMLGQQKDQLQQGGGGMTNLLTGMAGGLLMGAMEGTVLEISDKEIRMIKNGQGKASTYEVLERPDKDSVMIKQSDGEITTWKREGERLVMSSTGAAQVKLYFTRVKK